MTVTADTKPFETPAAAAPAPAPAPPKASAIGGMMKLLVPALLAAAASYGGARAAAAQPAAAAPHKVEAQPPGPTVPLDAFLVTVPDGKGKGHVMKVSVAIEFEHSQKEETLKPFAPRIRDAILSYLRSLTYEDAGDGAHMDKLRGEMLERCHAIGASGATRVLITDFVIQ